MRSQSLSATESALSNRPIVVGVAGGTGSGKTTVVTEILKGLDSDGVLVIQHDSYYRDRSHLPSEERANINYDHPDALETSLLIEHVRQLLAGRQEETGAGACLSRTVLRRRHHLGISSEDLS